MRKIGQETSCTERQDPINPESVHHRWSECPKGRDPLSPSLKVNVAFLYQVLFLDMYIQGFLVCVEATFGFKNSFEVLVFGTDLNPALRQLLVLG